MYSLVQSQRATAHTLQSVSDVNRECSRPAAASSVCDSTKHNGLVTFILQPDTTVFIQCITTLMIFQGRPFWAGIKRLYVDG